MTTAPLVFVSYAHKDLAWLEELQSHLGPHLRAGSLSLWDDTRMKGGDDWQAEIEAAMRACGVAILLVSRYSLTSDYIDRVEMKTILERVAKDGVRIYPIFVTKVSFPKDHWLRKYNWRPRDGRPLKEFPEDTGARDAEFVKIVDELVEVATQARPIVPPGRSVPPVSPAAVADRVPLEAPRAPKVSEGVGGAPASRGPVPVGGATSGIVRPIIPPQAEPSSDLTRAERDAIKRHRPKIDTQVDLERWLMDKPRDLAVAIAVRAALRVGPLLVDLRSPRASGRAPSTLLLPLLRSMAAPWAAVKFPARGAEVRSSATATAATSAAATAAADAADNAAGYAAYAAANAGDADAYAAADAADAAFTDAYLEAYAESDTTIADATAAAAADAAAATTYIAVSTDIGAWSARRAGELRKDLLDLPLWLVLEPERLRTMRREFSAVFASREEGWQHWLDWLEDRYAGYPADEEKDFARLTIPEKLWEEGAKSLEGVKEVNAEIQRRFDEIDARRAREATAAASDQIPNRPIAPPAEPGTDYNVGDAGLQAIPGLHASDPADRLERLHRRLAREVADLLALSLKVANSHPRLLRIVADYAESFEKGLPDLDLDHLWDTGISLVEMAAALSRDGVPLDERLAAEHQGLLNVVVAQHASLVHAIPELGSRAVEAEKMRARMSILASVAEPMARVLDRFAEADQGVESKTKAFLKTISLGFEATRGDHYEAAHSVYTNVTNILIRVGEHLDRIDEAIPEGARGLVEAVVDGDPENTRALVRIFGEIEPEIRAFAAPFPSLNTWIDWVYLRLERLKKL